MKKNEKISRLYQLHPVKNEHVNYRLRKKENNSQQILNLEKDQCSENTFGTFKRNMMFIYLKANAIFLH